MAFSFSSTTGRPGSDRKCLASKVCCRHLGKEQCFGHLMTAVSRSSRRSRRCFSCSGNCNTFTTRTLTVTRLGHLQWQIHRVHKRKRTINPKFIEITFTAKYQKWRQRHYTDQRNKSKTLNAKIMRKSKKTSEQFTQATQRVDVTSKHANEAAVVETD